MRDDLISRKAAIEALFDWEMTYDWDDHCREEDPKPAYIVSPSDVIEHLPSAKPEDAVMLDKETILQAGYKNREVEFRIGGRLFRVREVAQ